MAVKNRTFKILESKAFVPSGTVITPPPPVTPPASNTVLRAIQGNYNGPSPVVASTAAWEADFNCTVVHPLLNLDTTSVSALSSSGWLTMDTVDHASVGYPTPWMPSNVGSRVLVISVPICTGDVTLASAATGGMDSAWTGICQRAVNTVGTSTMRVIFRLGWEFDAWWMKCAITKQDGTSNGQEANYKAAWIRFCSIARGLMNSPLFDLCGSSKYFSSRWAAGYPGDAYVDIVGLDYYNQSFEYVNSTSIATRQLVWNKYMWDDLNAQWQFAKDHGKMVGYGEFGSCTSGDASQGGGDDTYFLDQLFHLIATGQLRGNGSTTVKGVIAAIKQFTGVQCAYFSYWNSDQGGDFTLYNTTANTTNKPNMLQMYKDYIAPQPS